MKCKSISENIKNIGKISSGTLIGQFISIISVPLITRLYGADIIGYWTLFNSIAIVINSFSDFGLTNAIMIKDNEDDSYKIYKVVTTINTVVAIISTCIMFFFIDIVDNYDVVPTSIIILILIITLQQIQISYTWLNKKQKYNVLMKNPILSQLSILAVSIPLGYFGYIKYGYFIGVMIGQIFTLVNMKKNLPPSLFTFKKADYVDVFKDNINFVKYQLPTTILTNIKNQFPTFLIKIFFGTTILGYYSISLRILNIPTQLLANAIGKVFFSTISKMKNEGKAIGEYVYNNLKKVTFLSVLPMVLLITMSNFIIYIVLGRNEIIAAEMMKAVSIQVLFTFYMASLSGIYIVIEKQDYALKSVLAQLCVYTIGFTLGRYILKDIIITLYLISLFYGLIQIVYFSYIFKAMNIKPIKYIGNISFSIIIILLGSFFLLKMFKM